ncbi:MAG: hypothetical protein LBG67_05155 [Campylobacteraceae bacterium]|jgi:hypothetical protein|nr:hypothetical protein [Campylobacteraceae bacterium]
MRIFVFSLILFFLQGCVDSLPPTTISIKQTSVENFTFESDKCVMTIPAKFLAKQSENGKLFVQRYIFKIDNSILTHEKISLDRNFIFSVGLNNIVYAGFEFKNYKTTNIGNFHTFFEGVDRGGENIYVLASGVGVFQDLSVVYSSSKDIIEKLATCVHTGQSVSFNNTKNNSNYNYSLMSYAKTDWSARMLLKYDIITSDRDYFFIK